MTHPLSVGIDIEDPKQIMTAAPPKVLIIEDDVSLSRAIALRLAQRGFEPFVTHDGKSGLEALSRIPDAVVLDLGLPNIRGLTVARRILESLETWHMPVIVITGDRSENISLYLQEIGAAAVLTKPFSAEHLAAVVERCTRDDA